MTTLQAVILTVVIITSGSLITWFVLTGIHLGMIVLRIRSGHESLVTLDKEKVKELTKASALGRFLIVLFPFAFWWLNGPVCLYYRLVKHNPKSTLSDPRGTGDV